MGQAETTANQAAVAKQLLDLFRSGIGDHVKVFRLQSQQQIAYAATNQIGVKARLMQAVQNLERILANLSAGNAVAIARDNLQAQTCVCVVFLLSLGCLTIVKQLLTKLTDTAKNGTPRNVNAK